MKTTIKKLAVLTLMLALMLPGAGTVYAANLTVTKTADTNDGVCDADCSLREAISAAAPGDTITVPANTNAYTLTQGHLFINKNLTINGSGMGNTIIEQTNQLWRVIDIGNPGGPVPVVSISKLTIKGGQAISPSNSQAFPGHTHGGGLHNHGIVTLTNVTFTGNSSTPANDFGGGIYNAGTATIVNVTIAENRAPTGFGGGIAGAPPTLTNTIVANNTGGNCSVAITAGSNNLQFPGTTCGSTIPTADPKLGPIDRGVYPLLAGSPAIDKGTNTGCPPTDQFGTPRPIDGDATPGAVCDIGAYEAPAFVAPGPSCDGQPATIYVNNQGIIVGGPNNGQVYRGHFTGTAGVDVIVGTDGKDSISARGGHDVICGGGSNDELEGGPGNDRILGEAGNDTMSGGGGNDTMTGGPGADKFNGGPGTDTATDFTPGQGDTKTSVENF